MKVTFHVTPVPASRPRVTRWSTFYGKKYTEFKAAMEIAKGDIHCLPLENNVYAKLDFFVQIPKSWSKKKKEAKNGKFCNNNADIDNYCKNSHWILGVIDQNIRARNITTCLSSI